MRIETGILTDTTASIPLKLVEELGIVLVPYFIHRGNETLRDGVDITPEQFAAYLETADRLPTTSNPSPGDYITGLKTWVGKVHSVLALTMTAKASGGYQSCKNAVDILHEWMPELDFEVEVMDTFKVAMAHGWAAIEAARSALTGASLSEVLNVARRVADRSNIIETADTLRYLYMGGRIGRAKHLVASLLDIKPIIGMEDGTIVALGTARSRLKAYAKIIDLMVQRVGEGSRIKVAFTHCAALEQLDWLRSQVERTFNCVEVWVTHLSPALAVHSGPGTVGLCYYAIDGII